jgi:hypothetical protein
MISLQRGDFSVERVVLKDGGHHLYIVSKI